MQSGIYKLTNKLNNKVYIGQSIDIQHRIESHSKPNDDYPIHKAILKYGFENFDVEILDSWECLDDKESQQIRLNALEQYYITKYNSVAPKGYNLTSGGSFNTIVSYETRRKISESNKGKHHTDETKAKISAANKGKVRSDEARKKVSMGNKGKVRTEEVKRRISESQKERYKNRPMSKETKKKLADLAKEQWKKRKTKID